MLDDYWRRTTVRSELLNICKYVRINIVLKDVFIIEIKIFCFVKLDGPSVLPYFAGGLITDSVWGLVPTTWGVLHHSTRDGVSSTWLHWLSCVRLVASCTQ